MVKRRKSYGEAVVPILLQRNSAGSTPAIFASRALYLCGGVSALARAEKQNVKIQILSDEMASRIAAGEVVERPASVVKELVENSIDAGATEISVWVERSGASLIRVSDNGEGMTPEDLALAVERHSTSKLRSAEDLSHIATLGFRGEALPSIGSVARLEIVSRPLTAPTGQRLRVVGGRKDAVQAAGAAVGTTVEIRELFFNTPARRKFLKSPATELSQICDVVNRIALAFPAIHFRLRHDGRNLADYLSVRDPKDRLRQILSPDISKNLAPFSCPAGNLGIEGYLSCAPVSYPNARYLFTFVNRRYVRDKVLTHAILQGYDTLLMKGQYPAVVLFLEVPYEEVDVNVHPAKFEVRFRRQNEIHGAVTHAIRAGLKDVAKTPSAPRGLAEHSELFYVHESPLPYDFPSAAKRWPLAEKEPFMVPAQSRAEPKGFFSALTVVGQVLGCYLVCESPKGLSLIDQHAAHERVAFEKLRRQLDAGAVEKQSLLIPQTVELTAGEALLLDRKTPLLDRFGFVIEPFGPNCFAITAAPALLPEGDYVPTVRRMVAELAEIDDSEKLRQSLEERLATIACHSVIRANRILEPDEMRALLAELDHTDHATQCPHGRPVLIEFSRDDLDRLFKRVV
jgi:DNA mismatch repair protein MutL